MATQKNGRSLPGNSDDIPLAPLESVRPDVEKLEGSSSGLAGGETGQRNNSAGYERIYLENLVPTLLYDCQSFRILEANEGALLLYRYSRENLLQLTLLDLFIFERDLNEDELRAELGKQLNVMGPVWHRTATGEEMMVRVISLPAEKKPGTEVRIALLQDETGRHSAEEALRTSEERYRELFENANDVIFLHDLNGRIVAINRAAEYLTGYSRREVVGQPFEVLIAPEARHQMQDSIRAHLGGSAAQHYELPIISKYGTRRFLEVSTRITYRRGRPVAVQGIGRDVTERKLAQQRLEETARELKRKNEDLMTALRLAQEATQLKEQFLANTSHELRTPMNGIMGMITLLQGTELQDEQREYADVVSQCANDLLTIINDLLDMSQIEAGKMSLALGDVNLQESVRSVVKLLSVRAAAKELKLEYEIDAAVPRSVRGDSVRFRQILTNLLANAIKFTATGGIQARLQLTPNGRNLRCEVKDSGIGVEESVQERIFEAFFQADGTPKRRFGGTGLGLAISKQLVEIMGGRIGMFNHKPGPGSTFWFELPLEPETAEAADALLTK